MKRMFLVLVMVIAMVSGLSAEGKWMHKSISEDVIAFYYDTPVKMTEDLVKFYYWKDADKVVAEMIPFKDDGRQPEILEIPMKLAKKYGFVAVTSPNDHIHMQIYYVKDSDTFYTWAIAGGN